MAAAGVDLRYTLRRAHEQSSLAQMAQRHKLMTDLMVMAVACDQTRVFNMVYNDNFSRVRRKGETYTHHVLTHEEQADPKLGYQPTAFWFNCKTMEGFEIVGPSFVVTGSDEAQMADAARGTRQQIAFYGSTPAYRAVLELHGWGELQDDLNRLSKQNKWAEMGDLVTDEILNTFAVVGTPEQIAPELGRRYGDVIQRISFYAPYQSDPDRWQRVLSDLRNA